MIDENGYEFLDAVFPVYKCEDQKTDIQQLFEIEKEKRLREYPLVHPEYKLVFDRFIYDGDPITGINCRQILGYVLFKAYGTQQQKTKAPGKA